MRGTTRLILNRLGAAIPSLIAQWAKDGLIMERPVNAQFFGFVDTAFVSNRIFVRRKRVCPVRFRWRRDSQFDWVTRRRGGAEKKTGEATSNLLSA